MNNIYVDELPKNCEKCLCYSYSDGFCNCECWYQKYGEIKDVAEYTHLGLKENERPTDCPLKPLTDRLAEERKKVVQEIRDKLCRIEDTLINLGNGKEDALNYFVKILYQIERNIDGL